MSRVALKPLPNRGVSKVIVGFDPPLRSFYLQVWTPTDDECPLVNKEGTGIEIAELAAVHADSEDALTNSAIAAMALDMDPGFVDVLSTFPRMGR